MTIAKFVDSVKDYLYKNKNQKNVIVGDFNMDILQQDFLLMIISLLEYEYVSYFSGITRPSMDNSNYGTCINNMYVKCNFPEIQSYKISNVFADHYTLVLTIKEDNTNETNKNS